VAGESGRLTRYDQRSRHSKSRTSYKSVSQNNDAFSSSNFTLRSVTDFIPCNLSSSHIIGNTYICRLQIAVIIPIEIIADVGDYHKKLYHVKNLKHNTLTFYHYNCLENSSMYIISVFRLILGVIFLVTGISKIPIFDAFAYSITELVSLSGTLLTLTAVAAIAFEIVVGVALIFNKWTQLFSGLLTLMLLTFSILLSSALFRYESYICTCFGVLGLKLPVKEQIIVDMVLLLITLFVFFFSHTESRVSAQIRKYSTEILASVITISIIWAGLIIVQPRVIFGDKPELTIDTHIVFTELPHRDSFHPRLVFMIDMADFLCPDCVADFLGMAEWIAEKPEVVSDHVFILVKRVDFLEPDEQHQYIERWQREHDYPFPLPIDSDDLFTRAGFEKSTALLYTALGSLEDVETFPMGSRRRNEIIEKFLHP
jgi:uncharacterized membrane protein YphA (DoxX/SURF4 family)